MTESFKSESSHSPDNEGKIPEDYMSEALRDVSDETIKSWLPEDKLAVRM